MADAEAPIETPAEGTPAPPAAEEAPAAEGAESEAGKSAGPPESSGFGQSSIDSNAENQSLEEGGNDTGAGGASNAEGGSGSNAEGENAEGGVSGSTDEAGVTTESSAPAPPPAPQAPKEEDPDAHLTPEERQQKVDDLIRDIKMRESFRKYDITNRYDYADFELSDYADSFKLFDILGDQKLGIEGVKSAMRVAGEGQSDKEFVVALNEVDNKGEGLFDFQKFLDLLFHFRTKVITEPELLETFELIDMDKSGFIDAGELKQLLTCVGNSLSQDEAEAMIEEADKDCSGGCDYEEFTHIILATQ